MAYDVVETSLFSTRFERALAFRLEEVGPSSARSLLTTHDSVCSNLSRFPYMGTMLFQDEEESETIQNNNASNTELRWVSLDSYIAIYRVNSVKSEVVLLDLFHETSNWRERLRFYQQ